MTIKKRIIIKSARIVAETAAYGRAWLRVENGKIAAIAPGDPPELQDVNIIDANGATLLPGFIDIHTHGGDGFDVMDGDADSLAGMARFFARGGVTSFLATTWTDSGERIQQALRAVASAQDMRRDGARLLGAHLEGPYLNAAKCGAQHSAYIRRADPAEALPWLDLNVIRLLSLAPEFPENHWLITEAVSRGVRVSVAHSNGGFDQIKSARDRGLSHATHAFNAMSPLHHREPGVVGAVLSLDGIHCELICDLEHVHPAAIEILWRCKGVERLILITDSVKIAGMPDGRYQFSHQEVEKKDGSVRICADGSLAGTTLTMNAALRNLMSVTKLPVDTLWRTASLNAAQAIGVDERKGSIALGKDADLVLVDDTLNVHMTIVEGRIAYSRDEGE
ncbi:MAG: N-acetylglucosamine-6-phosphate deacetylase [Chloroflexi bacterium]|nr:N-acetylglucosamine-6-phosphate deacetylase [Chloroflexota bacterium]